ncbi:hypothetical protein KZ483_04765 [Paenibacillus sp. sptzw28]|uniref:hypothetical protein n=1 Tax=Paenibacillus sp. sptzw28 TaxID=715179 RepID=UPI001C6F571C|nr:hypothetical protein [Paenibacillus sp. sptzw28]QYR22310.1 hypothetical protein KZ483_04765 [Paenibacillus sp. sptzw28]
MIKKIPKLAWFSIVIVLMTIWIYQEKLNEVEEHARTIKLLYQEKNDTAFITLLQQTPSFLPFAQTMEAISTSSEKENPARIQQQIERAKSQSKEWEARIWTLIEFSDDHTNNPDPLPMLNHSVGTSEKQNKMLELTFHARIWRVVYSVSGTYWKAKPKLIDEESRTTLTAIANELRSMEKTINTLKESADFMQTHEDYDETIKKQLIDQFGRHLEKLIKIQDDFFQKQNEEVADTNNVR